ncbi:hypothetical protein RAS1_09800 [Phycisphaerae bacterium RAS1]|nr:hypothetical protein RAS1_09800 [Phycisphaerae bacterium RAS1]
MKTAVLRANVLAMITLVCSSVACSQTTSAPAADKPPAAPPPGAATDAGAPAAAADPEVDKILTRLETREIRDLQAKLTWELKYVLGLPGEEDVKRGEIWYQKKGQAARFLIDFKEMVRSRAVRPMDEKHLFDGQWYVEQVGRTKTVTRRQIRRDGEAGDPFKLGEGPFPVPFGQKKSDILREFQVARAPADKNDPAETDHLVLLPRAESSMADRYKQLDFWISREGEIAGLPVKLQFAQLKGTGMVDSYVTIQFEKARLNSGFADTMFKLDTPAGYDEIVEPLASPNKQ